MALLALLFISTMSRSQSDGNSTEGLEVKGNFDKTEQHVCWDKTNGQSWYSSPSLAVLLHF